MLYLKNALGGIGRSVSTTARFAFAHAGGAARWRKFALYAAMFVLPGGSIAVVLMMWADRRRAQRGTPGAQAPVSGDTARISDTPLETLLATVAVTTAATAAAKAACSGVQLTCRAACAGGTRSTRTRAGTAALHAVHALRRWRRNDA